METFLVLGLCFILYEALDFFQGCIHSNTPTPSDQIEAYRRELDEQRQQQQQEQFLAGLTPLLGAQFAAAAAAAAAAASSGSQSTLGSTTATPTASTASVISDSYDQDTHSHSQEAQQQQQQQQQHSLSTPGLFRPAALGYYDPEDPLHATSSLPRDFYYLQQQQLKNKASAKSLLSKFSSTNSDNRIYPEAGASTGHSLLGGAVITHQPLPVVPPTEASSSSLFDCQPPAVAPHQLQAPSPLLLELKRAIISHQSHAHTVLDEDDEELIGSDNGCPQCEEEEHHQQQQRQEELYDNEQEEEDDEDEEEDLSYNSNSNSNSNSRASSTHGTTTTVHSSEPNISALLPRIHHIAIDDIDIGTATGASASSNGHSDSISGCGLAATSHADFREIECERLRRKCVSVKRIYSISEKF
ncbi:GL14277 [Drosophila persimilis]|uniref:GL14277 n=2 Tax=Drosophila persimilis TaxID=7234 RepID=B4GTG3_DROPE|nr:GL14277 [Drosophila persimilis]